MPDFRADSHFVSGVRLSANHDARAPGAAVDILLLHYTGMTTTAAAIERLCDPAAKVSSHYVIDEDGKILQLVPEHRRAWHAGVSSWQGVSDINSRSIGVEIGNPGHDFGYPDFPEAQVEALIALAHDIVARHRIPADRVLAHSDVAPRRKRDPGEKFPWQQLQQAGIGAWVEPAPLAGKGVAIGPGTKGADVARLQAALKRYGYEIEKSALYDENTATVITAFQRHFRPARVDGLADRSTVETLRALLAARGEAL